ncbi:hypothetical protein C2E23DRAFT_890054 [Lenzites betulinus]|nr:hypothetical protein C2E23DRAFT_890054 [Lenzites betulinus]
MTAVLQATDILRKDRGMDDNAINFSSPGTDWKTKYLEVADMLAETRAELDDFHHSSKELEEELERELERTEKAQQDLRVKVARAEQEREDWKGKFMSLQTTHNTTTTSLQRELDKLRQEYQKVKVQLRELEMGNDDLERNERAISSSLADMEQKYARVLEEKILLEHELLDKANMEEETQRVKDELRDANEEIAILKDQLAAAQLRANSMSTTSVQSSAPSSLPNATPSPSDEDLLSITTPPDLCLADITPPPETPAKDYPSAPVSVVSPRPTRGAHPSTPISMLQRAGFQPPRSNIATPPGVPSLARSATIPSLSASPSRIPPRTPVPRPAASRVTSSFNSSTTSTAGGVPSTASRSKGVQMVSEMRARVRVLEQKIHTRVPRLRMGSVTNRTAANAMPPPPLPAKASSSASPISSTSSSRAASHEDRLSPVAPLSRQSFDSDGDLKRTPGGDTSGWVLIMEDSPSPVKDKEKERRRTSSSSLNVNAPSSFRPTSYSPADSPSTANNSRATSALSQSVMFTGIPRPQSRLSISTEGRSSVSTNATTSTTSSIPTPSSRPSTPTFLPVPSAASVYGGVGLKRSTGPGAGAYSQPKRSSLGASTIRSPTLDSPSLSTHSNITVRAPKVPPPSALAQSRIGKPSSGRRSGGGSDTEGLPAAKTRARSGSTNFLYGRSAS